MNHAPLHVRLALILTLAAGMGLATLTPGAAGAATVEILGTRVKPVDEVRATAGRPPATGDATRWAEKAVRRIVKRYRRDGYTYARAWFRQEGDVVRILVDEGVMERVAFVGAGAYRSVMMQVDLNLPGRVFHGPTLARALGELRAKHDLLSVYHRVEETREHMTTELGDLVPARVLRIHIVGRESWGWGVAIDYDASFGLVPRGRYDTHGLLFDRDRVHTGLRIGVPYRKYLFEESAHAQWVHGSVEFGYRTPWFANDLLAAELTVSTGVSRYVRRDVGLRSYLDWRSEAGIGLVAAVHPDIRLAFESGIEYVHLFSFEADVAEGEASPEAARLPRFVAQLRARFALDEDVLRTDLGDELRLECHLKVGEKQGLVADTRVTLLLAFLLAGHDLIVRARGLYLAGDVRFWDEASLAGGYQRVFFGGRYWVREAGQAEVAFRLAVWSDIMKVGVFHDVSVFADLTGDRPAAAVVNAFGPSLHFLFLDTLALDLYYGFGFGPPGFDHAFSLELDTVF